MLLSFFTEIYHSLQWRFPAYNSISKRFCELWFPCLESVLVCAAKKWWRANWRSTGRLLLYVQVSLPLVFHRLQWVIDNKSQISRSYQSRLRSNHLQQNSNQKGRRRTSWSWRNLHLEIISWIPEMRINLAEESVNERSTVWLDRQASGVLLWHVLWVWNIRYSSNDKCYQKKYWESPLSHNINQIIPWTQRREIAGDLRE